MKANFEELDDKTRKYMLEEFEKELRSGKPYVSGNLSKLGKVKFVEFCWSSALLGRNANLASRGF